MKSKMRLAIGALPGIALFVVALPISSAAPPSPVSVQERGERTHVKQGEEVGKRVKQLQKYNKNVRNALAAFEKNEKRNGHKPKHDESFSVTLDPVGGPPASAALRSANTASPFREIGFKPQSPDYTGYGVEMIFIPTYSIPGEWQGTVIFNGFDPSGAYLGQYVADVAMTPDPTGTFWDVFYEVSYEDGVVYLYGNPDFELGTPRDSQDPSLLQPLISAIRKPVFVKAAFGSPQWCCGGPRPFPPPGPRTKQFLRCAGTGCGGAAFGCSLVGIVTFGAGLGPCFVGGCGTAIGTCGIKAVFGS